MFGRKAILNINHLRETPRKDEEMEAPGLDLLDSFFLNRESSSFALLLFPFLLCFVV